MVLSTIDWLVLAGWLVLTLAAGQWFSQRAGQSAESFFVSDRSLPWWVVGTSMVATTFAADTPLVISGLVAQGLHANWFWWTYGLSGALTVYLFARLWRRSHVLTDAELVELRYGGRAGAALRAMKAVWFGVFMNVLVVAWVMGAMIKFVAVLFPFPGVEWLGLPASTWIVLALFVLAVAYTAASGLYGVVATDVIQFAVAMGASVLLAVLAWRHAGGLEAIEAGYTAQGLDWDVLTALVPPMDGDPWGPWSQWLVLVSMVWWCQHNVDGGGYLAQRLFAARDERHAALAQLWFLVAHICLRPWPWIAVGMAGLALHGAGDDPERLYPLMIGELATLGALPAGLLGLLLASFLAAFMSTVDTQLNWGASLLVSDVFRRFGDPDVEPARIVRWSRATVVGLAVLAGLASLGIEAIVGAWKLAISVTAGLGTVYIARWYWWRVTAWCEIAAMTVAALCTAAFALLHAPLAAVPAWVAPGSLQVLAIDPRITAFPFSVVWTALASMACWIPVAYWTSAASPGDDPHLRAFYDRVRPGGPGWSAVAPERAATDGPGLRTLVGIASCAAGVYGTLLGTGQLVLGRLPWAVPSLAVAALGVAGVWWSMSPRREAT